MGRTELVDDPRFATLADRARNGDTINGIVAQWTSTQNATEVEQACIAHDVPVATAYTARDIALDPHFAARHDLVAVDDPILGALRQQAPYPRLVGEPAPIPDGAPRLGAHNREVWCDLVGVSAAELDALEAKGTV
jgi:crotonobetainyl-CoA:carnitine CoA-transferase CaiB-like acyl-CoA transferase